MRMEEARRRSACKRNRMRKSNMKIEEAEAKDRNGKGVCVNVCVVVWWRCSCACSFLPTAIDSIDTLQAQQPELDGRPASAEGNPMLLAAAFAWRSEKAPTSKQVS